VALAGFSLALPLIVVEPANVSVISVAAGVLFGCSKYLFPWSFVQRSIYSF
jgi:hypothetical protein